MATSYETRLGELALARGVANVRDLLECSKLLVDDHRALGQLLVEERGISADQIEELERELDNSDPDSLEEAFDRGETMVTQSIYTGTAQTLAQTSGDDRPAAYAGPNTPTEHLDISGDDSNPDASSPVPTFENISRYEFLDELGRGGMGQVMLARDKTMHRDIALKTVLPADQRPDHSRKRLVHEARVTGRLEHPSIVPTYDLGELNNGEPFYTMRVVRERSLHDILADRDPDPEIEEEYSLTQLVSILRQVALAMEYAHDQGVIHRDIKPENILIGAYGEVFIIDWGVAKVVDDDLTPYSVDALLNLNDGAILGTPRYMPPEQARGRHDDIDARSDVYSLGAVLYELLTLAPLFEADRTLMLLFKVVDEPPVPPSERRPPRDIPEELEKICLKAVAKDPGDRFESAQAFADELEMFLEGVKERERRRRMALEAVEEADRAREEYEQVRMRVNRLQDKLRQKRLETPAWAGAAKKEQLWELEQKVEDLQVEVERAFGEATKLYGQALGHKPGMPRARRALAELYWERFEEHEAAGNRARAAYFEGLVRQHNDGQYDRLLDGQATVSLVTQPPTVHAVLYRYEEANRRQVERRVAELGETPIGTREQTNGSYVIELDKEGWTSMKLPVKLERLEQKELNVRMYRRDQVPDDFAVIPGGPFSSRKVGPHNTDGAPEQLPDFAIKRHPVTCGEYVTFLNDLASDDLERARAHAPSHPDKPGSYFPSTEDGQFIIPDDDRDGDAWDPEWPICLVSADDARAYARWRSRRDGRSYRLPTADEWEKAARGVDGRIYPWGDHFDASFCKMDESNKGRSLPAPVGSFSTDCSPYGVMDMAGNIIEWTSTVAKKEGGDRRVLQGANFRSIPMMCRLDWTTEAFAGERSSNYGFRLVMDLNDRSD